MYNTDFYIYIRLILTKYKISGYEPERKHQNPEEDSAIYLKEESLR